MHDWLELLDAQHHSQVVIGAEVLGGVALSQVECPLLNVYDLVTEMAKFHVAEVLSKVVDAVLGEEGFQVVEAVTKRHHRYVLVHDKTHGSLELRWKLLLEVCACPQEQIHDRSQLLFLELMDGWHYDDLPAIFPTSFVCL